MTLTHSYLCELAVKWLRSNKISNCDLTTQKCKVVASELKSMNCEIPDAIGFCPSGHTILIECKTSIADYRRDIYKPSKQFGQMGNYRYYMTGVGLLDNEPYFPQTHGLIETNGTNIYVKKSPCFVEANGIAQNRLLLSMIRNPNRKGIWLK